MLKVLLHLQDTERCFLRLQELLVMCYAVLYKHTAILSLNLNNQYKYMYMFWYQCMLKEKDYQLSKLK